MSSADAETDPGAAAATIADLLTAKSGIEPMAVASLAVLVAAWQFAALEAGSRLLPAPMAVLRFILEEAERGDLAQQVARRLLVGLGERPRAEVVLHPQELEQRELDVADVGAVMTHPDLAPSRRSAPGPGARAGRTGG